MCGLWKVIREPSSFAVDVNWPRKADALECAFQFPTASLCLTTAVRVVSDNTSLTPNHNFAETMLFTFARFSFAKKLSLILPNCERHKLNSNLIWFFCSTLAFVFDSKAWCKQCLPFSLHTLKDWALIPMLHLLAPSLHLRACHQIETCVLRTFLLHIAILWYIYLFAADAAIEPFLLLSWCVDSCLPAQPWIGKLTHDELAAVFAFSFLLKHTFLHTCRNPLHITFGRCTQKMDGKCMNQKMTIREWSDLLVSNSVESIGA